MIQGLVRVGKNFSSSIQSKSAEVPSLHDEIVPSLHDEIVPSLHDEISRLRSHINILTSQVAILEEHVS